jgi:hypothetical protein
LRKATAQVSVRGQLPRRHALGKSSQASC